MKYDNDRFLHPKAVWNIPLYVQKFINFDEIDNRIVDIGPNPRQRTKIIVDKDNKFKWFYFSRLQINDTKDRVVTIKPSLYVVVKDNNSLRRLLIPQEEYLELIDLLSKFRKSIMIGVRFDRYMTLYKIYEALTKNRKIEFSAIRHALSHSKLDHKATIEKLNEFFGGTEIDFNKYRHRKIFYLQMAKLYKEVDKLLYERIKPLLSNTKQCFKNVEMVLPQPKTKQISLDSIT